MPLVDYMSAHRGEVTLGVEYPKSDLTKAAVKVLLIEPVEHYFDLRSFEINHFRFDIDECLILKQLDIGRGVRDV